MEAISKVEASSGYLSRGWFFNFDRGCRRKYQETSQANLAIRYSSLSIGAAAMQSSACE